MECQSCDVHVTLADLGPPDDICGVSETAILHDEQLVRSKAALCYTMCTHDHA